jgi:LSD1 subclass zinc finger protein
VQFDQLRTFPRGCGRGRPIEAEVDGETRCRHLPARLLHPDHLSLLGCPSCRGALDVSPGAEALRCAACGRAFPSVDGIFDAVMPDRVPPLVAGAAGHFEGLWGAVYSMGVTRPVVRAPYLSCLLGVSDVRFASIVRRFCAEARGPVLDVPVGGGAFLQHYAPDTDVIGVDLAPSMLGRAGRRARRLGIARLSLLRADVAALPLRDGVAQRIVSVNGLHCFPHRREALAELRRCLAGDGELVGATLLAGRNNRADRAIAHAHRIGMFGPPATEEELRAQARAAGFSRLEGEHEGSMLMFRFAP